MKTKHADKQRETIIWGRFSSDKQSDGDSKDRQDRLNRALAIRENLNVVKEYFDSGKSVKEGPTTLFKKIIAELPKGIGIVCENLDRISRGHPWRSKAFIADLLESGHFIYTSQDNRLYTEESIDEIENLLMGDLQTNLAYSENMKRGKRVREATHNSIELLRQGIPAPLGGWLPRSIKYNRESRKYDINPERAKIVERIFKEYLAGKGSHSIAAGLNRDGILSFSSKKQNAWGDSTIRAMLSYEGLIGTLVINNERIPNAFPPVITEKLFYKVQGMLNGNKDRKGNYSADTINNVFRGKCFCSHCGRTIKVYGRKNLGCAGARIGVCKVKTMIPFRLIEPELIKWFIYTAPDRFKADSTHGDMQSLLSKKDALNKRIEQTIDLLDSGLAVEQVRKRLLKLEDEKREVEKEISSFKVQQNSNVIEEFNKLKDMVKESSNDQELRKKISSVVPSVIKDITFDFSIRDKATFKVTLINGEVSNWKYIVKPVKGFFEVI